MLIGSGHVRPDMFLVRSSSVTLSIACNQGGIYESKPFAGGSYEARQPAHKSKFRHRPADSVPACARRQRKRPAKRVARRKAALLDWLVQTPGMDQPDDRKKPHAVASIPLRRGPALLEGSAGACALKAEVKAFWNRESCDADQAHAEKFSREYFEQIEQWRYRDQPFIHAFAQFTRYHHKRVLEVGFGAGTDFIQWLRAGARVSGIDLTEEALANVSHRIQVYGLPQPESLQVADAENLPFPANSFDLGYSWGVLHHTPNTGKALAELVRVVRPGGEIKVMLYNRHGLYAWKMWIKHALLKGRPWKNLRWVLANHVESLGTQAFTEKEIQEMLAPLGVAEIRMERFITNNDRVMRRSFPYWICGLVLASVQALTGNRLGWFRGISARKL